MIGQKTLQFLTEQKSRMVALDKAEGYDKNTPRYRDAISGQMVLGKTILYENALAWLQSRNAYTSLWEEFNIVEHALNEDTLATAAPTFTTFMLPLVRRMYNTLIAQDLVSVQPIPNPSAYIYYMDKIYTNTTAEVTALQRTDQQTPRNYPLSGEQASPIRELQMRLTRLLVETIIDKLKADWTLEAEQDWRSQYKLDVENEMIPELGDELARNLDRKILDALVAGIATTINWNPTGYLGGDTTTTNQRSYRRGIYDAVVDARAWIMNNKAGADRAGVDYWLVMNPNVWARFAKLEDYNMSPVTIDTKAALNHRYEGIMNGMYKCYVTPEIADNQILMGIKGGWKYAVGYFAPYVPLYTSPKYIINDDFTQFARGVMSRYAYGVLPETSVGTTNNGLVLISLTSS